MSRRVMQVIREFVPKTEVYSIDEIFADLSEMKYFDFELLAKKIREEVGKATGIPVSVGIAPTKTLAKMANRYAKKNLPDKGVFVAHSKQQIHQMLSVTEVGDIWGIGKQYASLLNQNGFYSAYDLAIAPEEWVRKNMTVVVQRTLHELRGVPCIPWEDGETVRKNICTSRSFGTLVSDLRQIRQAIAKFTASCASKLRKEKTCARRIQVFIQTNPHRPEDAQYFQSITQDLEVASNCTADLMKYAMKGLEMIYKPGYFFQKAGVVVMDLVPGTEIQLGMFVQHNHEKEKKLMDSMDAVNKVFGREMVRFGVQEFDEKWKLKQDHLSRSYSTKLNQSIKVKAG
jgi:DNA polymerase V